MTSEKGQVSFFPLFCCCLIQDPGWIKIRIRIRKTASHTFDQNKRSAQYIHHCWSFRLILENFLINFFRRLSIFLVAFSICQ